LGSIFTSRLLEAVEVLTWEASCKWRLPMTKKPMATSNNPLATKDNKAQAGGFFKQVISIPNRDLFELSPLPASNLIIKKFGRNTSLDPGDRRNVLILLKSSTFFSAHFTTKYQLTVNC
jgi:hypothetical protein